MYECVWVRGCMYVHALACAMRDICRNSATYICNCVFVYKCVWIHVCMYVHALPCAIRDMCTNSAPYICNCVFVYECVLVPVCMYVHALACAIRDMCRKSAPSRKVLFCRVDARANALTIAAMSCASTWWGRSARTL